MNIRTSMAAGAAALLCSAASAAGQACMGVPTEDADFNVRAEMALPDDARQYSAVVTADLRGPVSFELNAGLIDIDDVDDHGTSVGGKLGYTLGVVPGLSICPLAGAQYSAINTDQPLVEGPLTVDASTLVLAGGIGVGTTLGDVPGITLFAQPQYLYIRSSFDDAIRPEERDDHSELGIDAGARLSIGRLLLGGGVTWTTIADADPVLSVTAGLTF